MRSFFRDHFRPTLALKLGFFVLIGTGLIFITVFAYSNRVSRSILFAELDQKTRVMAGNAANRIESILLLVEPLPKQVGQMIRSGHSSDAELRGMLEAGLKVNSYIYGSAIAFEPGVLTPSGKLKSPYVHRGKGDVFDGNMLEWLDLGTGDYDYQSQDWYRIPKETGKAFWTDPYFDEGGGDVMMCTYCVPFYVEKDRNLVFAGVATADVQLDHLTHIASSITFLRTGYAMLISQSGQIISHPNTNYVFKESVFSLAEENKDRELRDMGLKMTKGEQGSLRRVSYFTQAVSWMFYSPVAASGWSVCFVFSEQEVLAGLTHMNRVVAWIGLGGFGLLMLVIVVLSASITRPIRTLARQTHEIARGNLEVPIPMLRSHDEVGDLSQSFEHMRLALKDYIAHLADTTAAKERIESELKIAQSIQRSFLPKRFPPFPDRTEFDIYADLQAAKEVGGDLYDFFLMDENHLFFSIGDVSGKGVPAALFMAVTKTLMKGVVEQQTSLRHVLEKVNHELYVDNEQMMFVTLFCGILNLKTGELQYSNAGHLPPVLMRGKQSVAWMEIPDGTILGISEEPLFANFNITLKPGDTLLLYTDGVTEAMSPKQALYGDDRLLQFANAAPAGSAKDLVDDLIASVHFHADGEPQSDDITVLALRFHGTV